MKTKIITKRLSYAVDYYLTQFQIFCMYSWAQPAHSNLRATPLSKSKYRLNVILCFTTSLSHPIKQPGVCPSLDCSHNSSAFQKYSTTITHFYVFLDNNGIQHDQGGKLSISTGTPWTTTGNKPLAFEHFIWDPRGFIFGKGMAFMMLLFSPTATHSKIFTLSLWPCFLSTLTECELDKEWSQ